MAPFPTKWFLLIFLMHSLQSEFNQYTTFTDLDGTHRWESITDFIPVPSTSFGFIPIGEIMTMEFDFIWWGRTNTPTPAKFEMFFRVGFDASGGKGCDGQGARYPSFWLTGNVDTMHVSVSSGSHCQPAQSLNGYGLIYIGISYHVSIAFNTTVLFVQVSGGGKPNWSQTWDRDPTPTQYIGDIVPIWWMSNKQEDEYNIGNGTFSNITLTSFTPTPAPTTAIPSITPTQTPTALSSTPTLTPITSKPTTANPTIQPTITPTNIPTHTPSFKPTTAIPTTALPTTAQPTTLSPSASPTTLYPTTNTPTTATPSIAPTTVPSTSPISKSPTVTGQTYSPTTQPTTLPTSQPSINPSSNPTLEPTIDPSMFPTTNPTNLPSETPTQKPITYDPPYTTTEHPIQSLIETLIIDGNAPIQQNQYEYVEITIFATVVALCFCAVLAFLAFLTFRRKVRHIQQQRPDSPKYHMELNGQDLPSKLALNNDSKSRSSNGEEVRLNIEERNHAISPDNLLSPRSANYSKSSRKNMSKSLKSPTEEHKGNPLDAVYLTLGQYKSDSAQNSHLSISVMQLKDATPTPAVSPNDNSARGRITSPNTHHKQAIVTVIDPGDISPEPTSVRETVGPEEEEDDDDDSDDEEKGYYDKSKARRKDNRANNTYAKIEMEEPYEQELDGYGVGLYTTPIIRNYGPYRKNTENTEGFESDNSENTDFFNSYNNNKESDIVPHKKKRKGYQWIKKTLQRVDSQNHQEYMTNFERHKVEDHRLGDLLADDWKELIPMIGPRNEFRRLWSNYSDVLYKNNGEFDEETTAPDSDDVHIDLQHDLLEALISDNDEKLKIDKYSDYKARDVDKLTFDDIKNKYGSNDTSKTNNNSNLSSVLSSIISSSDDDAIKKSTISVESMEISQSYDESKSNVSDEEYRYKSKRKSKSKKNNPIPSAIAEDQEIEDDGFKVDRLKPKNQMISPPISPPQYTSHQQHENNIISRKNPSSSSQSLMSLTMSEPPMPQDVDPEELKQPLNDDESETDDETVGIPRFHADVSDSDSDSSSETESETKSESQQHQEFGQEVDVMIDEALYDDDDDNDSDDTDEYETEEDDEVDDESISIDIAKSDDDGNSSD